MISMPHVFDEKLVRNIKNLGIIIDYKLSFKLHIADVHCRMSKI